MASRMAMLSAAAGAAATGARETTPALSEAGSETSSKRSHVGTLQHGLSLDLDDVFKLMDYLEKEGLSVISADTEAKAIARTKQKDNRPPQKFDDEAGILSRVRSNDAAQCLPNLDLSKSRLISAFNWPMRSTKESSATTGFPSCAVAMSRSVISPTGLRGSATLGVFASTGLPKSAKLLWLI